MLNMLNKFRSFAADKSGAVTVDWVALTAAVVVIGIALVYAVFGADETSGFNGIATQITTEASGLTSTIQSADIQSNAPTILQSGS
ncbi:MAG: hypothetical protein AAFP78_16440 [Pseudomonadota bacterium]